MTARKASSRSLKSIAGGTLLALGLVILLANLDSLTASMSNFAGLSAQETLGILPAVSLAGLHALQSYIFDRSEFLSALQRILISFWPLILVIIGALLLQVAFKGRFAARALGESSESKIAHE